jgi:hypothetical protein
MEIELKNGHLILPRLLIAQALSADSQVSLKYYTDRRTLVIAGKSKAFFEKLHQTEEWLTLKEKNIQGDKSLFIRGLLIDHEIDETDRKLVAEVKSTGIISIQL